MKTFQEYLEQIDEGYSRPIQQRINQNFARSLMDKEQKRKEAENPQPKQTVEPKKLSPEEELKQVKGDIFALYSLSTPSFRKTSLAQNIERYIKANPDKKDELEKLKKEAYNTPSGD